jgi:hypothetical protein
MSRLIILCNNYSGFVQKSFGPPENSADIPMMDDVRFMKETAYINHSFEKNARTFLMHCAKEFPGRLQDHVDFNQYFEVAASAHGATAFAMDGAAGSGI